MKKAVFIDVDGTLYKAHDLSLTDSVKEKLKEASKYVDLYIATGRAYNVLTCLNDVKHLFKGYVVSNGSIVMIDNEIIFESVIENELKDKLIEVAKKYNATLSLLTHEHIYTNVINYYVDKALTPRDEGSLIDLNGYNYLDIKYNMAWTFEETDIIDQMEKELPEFDFFKWGSRGADIIVKSITKAKGIKKVLEQMGYDLNNTYAIGDSSNDVPMFKLVNTPIAMGNATEHAKANAKYITLTQEECGLELALDNIIKGKW